MAFPIILVDSGSGSDSLASGAGPATAKNGSAAATDGVNGKTVTITDASSDLSSVATDGSASIYIADATAGHRNFDQITAVSGSVGNWTVTVANGFSLSLSGKSWAIGGKRATLDNANTRKLFANNGAAGDAMPGWTIQLDSDQSISAELAFFRSGNTTNGPIRVTGNGTVRTITQSANAAIFRSAAASLKLWQFDYLGFSCTAGTKTSAYGFATSGATNGPFMLNNCVFGGASNQVLVGVGRTAGNLNGGGWQISDCYFQTAGNPILINNGSNGPISVRDCFFVECGATIDITVVDSLEFRGNVVTGTVGVGLTVGAGAQNVLTIIGNVFHDSSSHGFDFSAATPNAVVCHNNIFANNLGYGVNGLALTTLGWLFDFNAYWQNSSGDRNNAPAGAHDLGVDPQFTNAAGLDFSVGDNLLGLGYPLGGTDPIGQSSSTYSYVDIGASQRQQTAGGGRLLVGNSFSGGML